MKTWLLIPLALSACVSMQTYRAAEVQRDSLVQVNKGLRKEIKLAQQENQALSDSLRMVKQRHATMMQQVQERLRLPSRIALRGSNLSLREPAEMEYDYTAYRNSHNFKDTHSARLVPWMTQSEKMTLYWLNVARLDPKGFCRRFVLPAYRRDSSNAYLASLVDYMMRMQPRNALLPDQVQYNNAACHARSSGSRGYVGHTRQTAECKTAYYGECCAYGNSDPLRIVLQLLIDEGVPSLGHRYICLGRYDVVGIATAPHTGYGSNTVLNFR